MSNKSTFLDEEETREIIDKLSKDWIGHSGLYNGGLLPTGKIQYKPPRENPLFGNKSWILEKSKPGCDHQWINVGFHFDKIVCKKCDCEKK